MDYAKHTTTVKDPIVVVQENRSKFELINKNRINVDKVQVDGGLISCSNTEKCDWILSYKSQSDTALFIELKGCDIDKAISQLVSTLGHTKDKYQSHIKKCFAVTTRIPKHGSTMRKKALDFHNKTKTILVVKNLHIKHEI